MNVVLVSIDRQESVTNRERTEINYVDSLLHLFLNINLYL